MRVRVRVCVPRLVLLLLLLLLRKANALVDRMSPTLVQEEFKYFKGFLFNKGESLGARSSATAPQGGGVSKRRAGGAAGHPRADVAKADGEGDAAKKLR